MRRAGALGFVAAAVRAPSLIAQVHDSKVVAATTKTTALGNAPVATGQATALAISSSGAPSLHHPGRRCEVQQQQNNVEPCSKANLWWKHDVMAVYNHIWRQTNGQHVDKKSFLAGLRNSPCNVHEVPTNTISAFKESLLCSDLKEYLKKTWRFTYNGGQDSLLIGRLQTLDQRHWLLGEDEWLRVKDRLLETVSRLYASSFTYPLIRARNVVVWGCQKTIRACLLPTADINRREEDGAPSLDEQKEAIEKLICYSVLSNEDVVEPEPKAESIHQRFMTIYEEIKKTNKSRVPVAEFVAKVRAKHDVLCHIVSEPVYRTYLASLSSDSPKKISSSTNGFSDRGENSTQAGDGLDKNFYAYQAMRDMKEFLTQKVFTCKFARESPVERSVLLLIDKRTTLSRCQNFSAIDCVALWTKLDALLTMMVHGNVQSDSVIVWRENGTIKVCLLPCPFSHTRLATDVFLFREQQYASVLFLTLLSTAKGGKQLHRQLVQLGQQTALLHSFAPPPGPPTSFAGLSMVPPPPGPPTSFAGLSMVPPPPGPPTSFAGLSMVPPPPPPVPPPSFAGLSIIPPPPPPATSFPGVTMVPPLGPWRQRWCPPSFWQQPRYPQRFGPPPKLPAPQSRAKLRARSEAQSSATAHHHFKLQPVLPPQSSGPQQRFGPKAVSPPLYGTKVSVRSGGQFRSLSAMPHNSKPQKVPPRQSTA